MAMRIAERVVKITEALQIPYVFKGSYRKANRSRLDSFTGIGDLITRLSGTFDKARKQLYDGTGNVMRRVESLKGLGVTPKKQIKGLEE